MSNSSEHSGTSEHIADVDPENRVFEAAQKQSLTIAGHQTSIRLEPLFWNALLREAADMGLPVNALVARIDVARLAGGSPPNLASALRLWLLHRVQAKSDS